MRVSHYENKNLFNFKDIEFPAMITPKTFKTFEKHNPKYCLSVYQLNTKSQSLFDVIPFYIYPDITKEKQNIKLLVIYDDETGQHHYTTITDWHKFCNSIDKNKTRTCEYCLHRFLGPKCVENLEEHEIYCRGINDHQVQKVTVPKLEDSIMKFEKYKNQSKTPFSNYCDFEATLEKKENTLKAIFDENTTEKTTYHKANSYNFLCVDSEGKCRKEVHYHGEDPAKHCIAQLLELQSELNDEMNRYPVTPELTDEEKNHFNSTHECHLCGQKGMIDFSHVLNNKTKIVEHDHYTGKYNGPAHQECNLKNKQSKKINVFFHNLKGYDAHHLITACNEYSETHDVSVIATTAE